jgi:hypothetical protein
MRKAGIPPPTMGVNANSKEKEQNTKIQQHTAL